NLAGDIDSTNITLDGAVTADGSGNQTFDAGTGTLRAKNAVTKTNAGNLTLSGETLVDLEGKVQVNAGDLVITDIVDAEADLQASGLVHLQHLANVAGNVRATGSDITFEKAVTADGSGNQTFDAGTGTLWAKDTITKTGPGNLTLGGDTLVNLDGKVQVNAGNLAITDPANAEADLEASGSVTLNGPANLAADIDSTNITLNQAVTADGSGNQTFDAGTGTLWAKNTITKASLGDLTLSGEADIDLDGTVDVLAGNLAITDDFSARGDLLASGDITLSGSPVNATLDGSGDQSIDAINGTLTANGYLSKITNGSLLLHGGSSGLAVDVAGTMGVASGNLRILAENGDIQLSGNLTSLNGGVSIISGVGSIYSVGNAGALNVAITASSNDGTGNTGVALNNGGKAAIVIISKETLTLGTNATLTAGGLYNAGLLDDRPAVYFLNSGELGGERIDVAIYLASNTGNVHVGSGQVTAAPGGTMVVDAYQNVAFGNPFVSSLGNDGVDWLEACSRITTSLEDAADKGSLPFADDEDAMDVLLSGPYMLRGNSLVQAEVFYGEPEEVINVSTTEAEASSTVVLTSPEIEGETMEIGGMVAESMQWLGEELGLCQGDETGEEDSRCQEITQTYLAGAYLQATDLRPHQAANQLRQLAAILQDTGGTRNAALSLVINEFTQPELPPSAEQLASIGQVLEQHSNDGTHYAVARAWLEALTEYVSILVDNIGWSQDESVEFVMGKYGPSVTEASNISITAFIQMYLESNAG
ncbi:MAG: beta strand repeat-containing protein, partial [Planctomycetota bacterium]